MIENAFWLHTSCEDDNEACIFETGAQILGIVEGVVLRILGIEQDGQMTEIIEFRSSSFLPFVGYRATGCIPFDAVVFLLLLCVVV